MSKNKTQDGHQWHWNLGQGHWWMISYRCISLQDLTEIQWWKKLFWSDMGHQNIWQSIWNYFFVKYVGNCYTAICLVTGQLFNWTTDWLIKSLAHSLTHLLTHSLTHSLTFVFTLNSDKTWEENKIVVCSFPLFLIFKNNNKNT